MLICNSLLSSLFQNLREEEIHRNKLLLHNLKNDEAIAKGELFGEVVADSAVVEIISMWRSGFTADNLSQIVSIVRKKVYSLHKIVGVFTVYDGAYELSDLFSAAVNNGEFVDELKVYLEGVFKLQPLPATAPHAYPDIPGVQLIQMHEFHAVPLKQPLHPATPESLLHAVDITVVRNKIKNLVWHKCEEAVMHPAVTLKKAMGPP